MEKQAENARAARARTDRRFARKRADGSLRRDTISASTVLGLEYLALIAACVVVAGRRIRT